MPLKITKKELESFVNGDLPERFEEVFNDIPLYHPDHIAKKGETHRNYIDDGREYRWFIFKDLSNGEEYHLNYTYNSDCPNDLLDFPSSITIVDNSESSDLYVKPEPIIVPEIKLTPLEIKDNELKEAYKKVQHECLKVIPKQKLPVPKERIDELLNLLKTNKFSIYDVRAIAYPICIEYKLEESSFWHWIQVKRGFWKS